MTAQHLAQKRSQQSQQKANHLSVGAVGECLLLLK